MQVTSDCRLATVFFRASLNRLTAIGRQIQILIPLIMR